MPIKVTPKKDFKIGRKFQGDYKGKNLPERAVEAIKTAGKQTAGTLKEGAKQIPKKIKRKQAPKPLERGRKAKTFGEKMADLREKKKKFKSSRSGMMGGGMMQMPRAMYKKGGKSFPDLSGDGKVTMKDILMGRGVIPRKGKKGGGLMEATSRLRAQGLKAGGVAKGCGAVMNDRRKVTKVY